jgi:oxaloacetate decarboxylase gamma subunit
MPYKLNGRNALNVNKNMNIEELLMQGLNLMLLGMGMVFFILTLLIFILKWTSALIAKYVPHTEPPAVLAPKVVATANPESDPDLLAAISIAIHRYRSNS